MRRGITANISTRPARKEVVRQSGSNDPDLAGSASPHTTRELRALRPIRPPEVKLLAQMARKPAPPAGPTRLTVARSQVAAELEERIASGEAIGGRPISSPTELKALKDEYYTWHEYNERLLKSRFTTEEVEQEYAGSVFGFGGYTSFAQESRQFGEDLSRHIRKLRSIKGQLGLYEEPAVQPPIPPARIAAEAGGPTTIFVVHGHDEGRKSEVTVFLRQVARPEVVVLHEKASQSRTIIEKFEAHASHAAYAVVLLTGDDEGGPAGSNEQKRRARQNVVFELGFFIGALGRSRVTVLYEEDVELPSDVTGVLYVRLDAKGSWKFELARELKEAQIEVDLNNAI